MPLPDIDLRKIRTHKGTQDKAFEELCCQLASLEDRPLDAVFHRKGAGADAGVECFIRYANGSEIGWQAKFYSRMDSSLTGSLDNSIETALKKHPTLRTYIVCLPFNLSDARKGKNSTPLQQWDNWRQKWINKTRKDNRDLDIKLWNESEIIERLGRDNPLYFGRALYWFDQENLTSQWFRDRFSKACADLGHRYTPETNVDLPIRKNLLAFARDPFLNNTVEEWIEQLTIWSHRAKSAIDRLASLPGVKPLPVNLEDSMTGLLQQLSVVPISVKGMFSINSWRATIRNVYSHIREAQIWAWDQNLYKKKDSSRVDVEYSRRELMKLSDVVDDICSDLDQPYWAVANARQLLVYGDGGTGKSHLFADSASYQIDQQRPAMLLLGSKFNDGDLWDQILKELDCPNWYQAKTFLGALDAAGQAAGTRALIVIDALNERNGVHIWKHRLAGFLHEISKFPYVSVVMSCRTPFLESVIPDSLGEDVLPRIEHTGFSYSDATYYLKARGFVLPGSPNLMPEFTNPLFLKTCCDSLEKENTRVFPRGLNGVSTVFDFYNNAVVRSLNKRMNLEPRRRYVEKAIRALSQAYVERGEGYMPYDEVSALFEEILPSIGSREKDLLSQLESEGMLSVELIREDSAHRSPIFFGVSKISTY